MGFWISWGGWNFKAGAPWQAVTAAWHVGEPSGAVFLLGCSNFLTGQHLDNSYSGCALWAWIDMDSMAHDGTWQESACAKTIKKREFKKNDLRQEAGESWSATPGNLDGILFRCQAEPGNGHCERLTAPHFWKEMPGVITEECDKELSSVPKLGTELECFFKHQVPSDYRCM